LAQRFHRARQLTRILLGHRRAPSRRATRAALPGHSGRTDSVTRPDPDDRSSSGGPAD
jgi:hypothetical protein